MKGNSKSARARNLTLEECFSDDEDDDTDDDDNNYDDDKDDNNVAGDEDIQGDKEVPNEKKQKTTKQDKAFVTYPVYCITTVDKYHKSKILSIAICSAENNAFIPSFYKGLFDHVKYLYEAAYADTWRPHVVIDDGSANIAAFTRLKQENFIRAFTLCKFHVVRNWWVHVNPLRLEHK